MSSSTTASDGYYGYGYYGYSSSSRRLMSDDIAPAYYGSEASSSGYYGAASYGARRLLSYGSYGEMPGTTYYYAAEGGRRLLEQETAWLGRKGISEVVQGSRQRRRALGELSPSGYGYTPYSGAGCY